MQALAGCGARISDIESHDLHGLLTEAAIQLANVDFDVECKGVWPDGFRSASPTERINLVARMFARGQITEATSYWDGIIDRRQFHIRFWHESSSGGKRQEGTCQFEIDLDRAKAHALDINAIAEASDKFGDAPSGQAATIKDRSDTI